MTMCDVKDLLTFMPMSTTSCVSTPTTEHSQDIVQSTIKCSPSKLYFGTIKGKSKFPEDITDADIKHHFSKFKTYILDTTIVRDSKGSPKGFGFVTFSSHEIAETARKAFSKQTICGCEVRLSHYQSINESLHVSKVKHPVTSEDAKASCSSIANDSHSVCSPNLPYTVHSLIAMTPKTVKSTPQKTKNSVKASCTLSVKDEHKSEKTLRVEGMHSYLPDSISDEELVKHFSSFKDDIVIACMIRDPRTQQAYGIITFSSFQAANSAQKKYNATHLCRKQIRVTPVKSGIDRSTFSNVHATVPTNQRKVKSESSPGKSLKRTASTIKNSSIINPASVLSSTEKIHETSKLSSCLVPRLCDGIESEEPKSSPESFCDKSSSSSVDIVIENLSPLFDEEELKALIQTCGATVISLNIDHDSTDPDETCIAYVSLVNQSHVADVMSGLTEREYLKRKLRVYKCKSKQIVEEKRKVSYRVYQFICYHYHTQVKQFQHKEGVLKHLEGNAILSCRDKSVLSQFLLEVFSNTCVEKRVDFDSPTWRQLTASKEDDTPNLLDEAKSNFSVEAEAGVYIVPQTDEHAVLFVGTQEGVKTAHGWVLSRLYRKLKVDSVKMETLVTLHPNLDSELSKKHQVNVLSYSKESTEIVIEGDGTNVQTAHRKIKALVSKFATLEVEFEYSLQLLESARKRIKEDKFEVCIEVATRASKGSLKCLTIRSFNPRHLHRSAAILKGKPIFKSLKIPSNVIIDSRKLKSVQKDISSEHLVSVRLIFKDKICTSLLVSGFTGNDVSAAHAKLQENLSGFSLPRQQRTSSCAKKVAIPMQEVKVNSEASLKAVVPSVTHRHTQSAKEAVIGTISHRPNEKKVDIVKQQSLKSDNRYFMCSSELLTSSQSVVTVSSKHVMCDKRTLWFEAHYVPFFLSHNNIVNEAISKVEKVHGVQIRPTSPSLMNSVVKQIVFRISSNNLIAVQLCCCNLIYEKVDAIINFSCNVPEEMQAIGGTTLQIDLDNYIASHQPTTASEVFTVLESGKLPCKRIIHAFSCLAEHVTLEQQKISVIHEALKCACKYDLQTISFASTCADTLSVEKLMHDIQVFFIENPNSCIHLLRIVCSSDKVINAHIGVKEFASEEDIYDLPKLASMKPPLVPHASLHQWYWQGNDGIFVAYSKDVNDKLCVNHEISPKGRYYFQIGSSRYMANFERMEQINMSTNFVRNMKVECEGKNKHTSTVCVSTRVSVEVKWLYHGEKLNQKPTPHSTSDCSAIEKLYFSTPGSANFVQGSRRFLLDFKTMKKHSQEDHACETLCIERKVFVRRISCHSPPSKWYYMGDTNTFIPYSTQHSLTIETMYQNRSLCTLSIQSRKYTFDFTKMKQINTATGNNRSVKRVIESTTCISNCTEIVPQHHICRVVLVAIKGPSRSLINAKHDLETKLRSMLCTRELPLPSSVSSPHSKTRIKNVAKKHNVLCNFSWQTESTASDLAPSVDSKVQLSGEDSLIQIAIKAIMEEIASSSGVKGNTADHEIPPEWQHQRQNTKLFELSESSNEYVRIKSSFHSTMTNAVIVSIKRIQNNWLWERYVMTRKRLSEKNNGRVNEKRLFHGSRNSQAHMIYDSEEGFDMRYSSKGMWGQANYFAEKASYSDSYAFEPGDGTKEILVAKVLTGDSYKCPSDQTLRMPPIKCDRTHFQQERYDTVEGETNGSTVFMTYTNDKAYPAYLIIYTPRTTTYDRLSLFNLTAATQTSTSSPNWSYNLTTSPSSMQSNTSPPNAGATGGASPSVASGLKYQPKPLHTNVRPSTTHQTATPQSNKTSSCILQ